MSMDILDKSKTNTTLVLNSELKFEKKEEIQYNNEYYIKVRIGIMSVGTNSNGSYMTKETIIKALPSLSYMPILASIQNDDCTDHATDEFSVNGNRLNAYGVILENPNPIFEEVECADGIVREFLYIDGLVWNRFQDFVQILERDKIKNQSMEIVINSLKMEEGSDYIEILDFDFIGACILGNDVTPAYINSNISIDKYSMFSFSKTIQEKLSIFNKFNKASEKTSNDNNNKERSNVVMTNEVKEQVVETQDVQLNEQVTTETVNTDVDTNVDVNANTDANTDVKTNEVVDVKSEETKSNVDTTDETEKLATEFSEQNNSQENVKKEANKMQKDETSMSENDKGMAIKFQIDLEEKDKEIAELKEIIEQEKEKFSALEKEYALYKHSIDTEKKQELLAKYSSILKNEEEYLELLKGNNIDNYSADSLEKELTSIIGKKSLSVFSQNNVDTNRAYFTADSNPKQNSIFGNFFN